MQMRRFIAYGLVTVGGLMALLCGACTLLFGGGGLIGIIQGEDAGLALTIFVTALIVGGIPALIGFVLARSGLRTLKETSTDPPAA